MYAGLPPLTPPSSLLPLSLQVAFDAGGVFVVGRIG
jgi:hypothetical protein